MNIPFLDLKKQYNSIKEEVLPAINNVLDNTAYILGKAVTDFEKEFAQAHSVKHCIATGSGTDANHLALWALDVKQGDEVIVPANTFIATAWGATLCGATPVFVDCDPISYNMDPDKVEQAITSRTKAIVAVHLYGQAADINRLAEIANRHNITLVEDCAQAHLAEYNKKKVGGLSKISSFSFYPGKNLGAYGEGGAVVTNDDELALKVKMLRDHGAAVKYYHEYYGHNYRMDGIQGAVLGVKLKHLEDWTTKRRNNAEQYKNMLEDVEEIILPYEMNYAKHVYHLFVIKVKDGKDERDKLAAYLNESGIATGLHYPIPLHLQKCFKDLGYMPGDFPNTEELADCGLSLPMFAELEYQQIEYISGKIKEYFATRTFSKKKSVDERIAF